MADTSSGVSGSSQNGSSAAEQSRAANEAAEAQRAAEAAAAAAINTTPTPALDTVQAAPVDLSISMTALSQLNAMQVSTPTLDFSSLTTLGGVPTATTYADVALSTPPATPTAAEYSAYSATFSIDGINAADPAATDIGSLGVNVGAAYTDTFNANMNARFGLDPANVTFSGSVGYSNDLSSFNLSATAGPFGSAADPNYGAAVSTSLNFDGLNRLSLDAAANFNTQGFQNGNVTVGLTHDFSDKFSGYAKGTVNFDSNGFSGAIGEAGMSYKDNGTSLGVTGRTHYNAGTGGITGYFGVRADIRF